MSQGDLKQILKEKGQDDKDLYSHLANVVSKYLLDNPDNCYDILEDYSLNVKQSNYDFKNHDQTEDNSQRIRENNGELKEYVEKTNKFLEKLNDGGEEPQPVETVGYVPNFMEEAKWFEKAGVGFGEEETYRIFKSLTALSFKKQATQVRLWGKILCSGKDYWVAEGLAENADDDNVPDEVEKKGQPGVNLKNYWVTTDLMGEWTELPYVTPQQIIVSRQIKYVFTGDLNRKVITNPHFEGLEQHLLKCQIVRISHTTSIIPAGLYKVNEDEPRELDNVQEELGEDFKYPEFEQLAKLNGWVHYSQGILNEGRQTHSYKGVPEGDDNEEELKKQYEQKDPFEPRLKPLSQDQPPKGYNSAWSIKSLGDTTNYNIYHTTGTQNNGVISIKSLVWPGFINVYFQQQQSSLYIGQGFKNSDQLYYPALPETVLEEVVDKEDYDEPNYPPEEPKAEGEEEQENQEDDN
ncbi:hypothetical protein PPERSA_06774 [Pseudocohnilembus persalinus]|uniref:Radial spokehead-like protein n=1 Tax=Pseudocohnilembus persalinus TaxID=266149 RepID=A0A0V0QSF3_PSEPJ|nr:hypothetical protein PPERSA_06774 [Pseudocohnilembus persalinus]|eukprot:KRX05140.1 hypothetical protein PPERSA_06774 [Pseudocohnilembus persalinus]